MTAGPSVVCKPGPIVWVFASASGRVLSVLAWHPPGGGPPPAVVAFRSRAFGPTPPARPDPRHDARRGPLVPWILAIARNRALDALRRRRRWWRKAERWEQAQVAGQDVDAPSGPDESAVPGWPLHREVHAALAALPEEQRRVRLVARF